MILYIPRNGRGVVPFLQDLPSCLTRIYLPLEGDPLVSLTDCRSGGGLFYVSLFPSLRVYRVVFRGSIPFFQQICGDHFASSGSIVGCLTVSHGVSLALLCVFGALVFTGASNTRVKQCLGSLVWYTF